ncbi:adenine phosphoribosyltransferase [Spongisporangium articulatum]|uniref:Adenine phosphoribosyltransferase n=1 Tax=Spongisporangium articulatum TaxID=3362603 RepID=A0ABW8ASC7_9ACTN
MSISLAEGIRDIPDHPSAGIMFRDITPLLADPEMFEEVITQFVAGLEGEVDLVTGIEARGFILAAPVALALGVGFVPIRKAGKLPYETESKSYQLEYGEATIEVHKDAVKAGQRVLLVDDVLATGGTARAGRELVEGLGGKVIGARFLIELEALEGRKALGDLPVTSLVTY